MEPKPTSPARATPTDEGTGPPHDNRTELPQPQRYVIKPITMHRHLGELTTEPSTNDRLSSSLPPTPSLKSTTEYPTSMAGSSVVPTQKPGSVGPGAFLPDSSTEPLPTVSSHALDNVTETGNDVRDGPSDSDLNQHGSSGAFWVHGFCGCTVQ
jgi:hypothetical protein